LRNVGKAAYIYFTT